MRLPVGPDEGVAGRLLRERHATKAYSSRANRAYLRRRANRAYLRRRGIRAVIPEKPDGYLAGLHLRGAILWIRSLRPT
ncbi:hypothetical protein FHR32_008222 [Streptosporangium album]|uniref:Uncharacterized protein n=1 Tax=Streptosporangium album TaxID=47479 RepID=A0A7W7S4N1_9ACTN|nr:hypothetical protein [Streptosporangium album]MBB4943821.1 hypothetical protein [Streptosporangium album]